MRKESGIERERGRRKEKEREIKQCIASNIKTFKGCSVTPPLRTLRLRLPIAVHCSTQVRLRPCLVVTGEGGTVTR